MHADQVSLGFLNEIVQMYKIVQYINWKKFHYLESSEIEITSFVNALLPNVCKFFLVTFCARIAS